MATDEQVVEATGYRVGTVSPFGLPRPMRILIERRVLDEVEISIGSGVAGIGIIMESADLRRGLPEAEVVSLL